MVNIHCCLEGSVGFTAIALSIHVISHKFAFMLSQIWTFCPLSEGTTKREEKMIIFPFGVLDCFSPYDMILYLIILLLLQQFLKEILNELCVYNKRGTNQGTYELKPEYKKSVEETGAE